jgi:hypothetical protein
MEKQNGDLTQQNSELLLTKALKNNIIVGIKAETKPNF